MNAEDARRTALNANQAKEAFERNRIFDIIKRAAESGQYSISVESLSTNLIALLRNQGYKVTVNNDYNELSVTISWE
jgi:alpha-amylase/alpha-mannosidase (GH57 family)